METKLFKTADVKKFFDILYKMDRGIRIGGSIYKGRKANYPENDYCQMQVFVDRTVNKWLKGKYVILYTESEQTELLYKKYVHINGIELKLDWSNQNLNVYLYDYSRPMDLFNTLTISHNDALGLEGEWIADPTEYHNKLRSLFELNIPEKEYVFEAYDWGKYPKRGVKREKALELIKTTVSFFAKTEHEAYQKKKQYKEDNFIITELIEVK